MREWALFLLAVVGGGLVGLAFRTRKVLLIVVGCVLITAGGGGLRKIEAARATTRPAAAHARTRTRPRPRVPRRPAPVPLASVFANPVFDGDFPDPFVLRTGDRFYAYATNTLAANVPAMYSRDLVHWKSLPDALPQLPPWAEQGKLRTWAPSVLRIAGEYRMYVTVGHRARQSQCIGVATSAHPAGPFTLDPSGPLICGGSGALDANPFRAADGTLWLDWKNELAGSGPPQILAQQLAADGRTLIGAPTALLTPSLWWEHGNVEGPSMLYRGGEYLLFYSAADWQTATYTTGLAHCSRPTGPCTKDSQPLITNSIDAAGPGGLTPFIAGNDVVYAAFHSWHAGVGYAAGGVRSLNIRRLTVGNQPALANVTLGGAQ